MAIVKLISENVHIVQKFSCNKWINMSVFADPGNAMSKIDDYHEQDEFPIIYRVQKMPVTESHW